MSSGDRSGAAELASLARALRAHLDRQSRLGLARTAPPPEPPPAAASAAAVRPAAGQSQAPASAPPEAPGETTSVRLATSRPPSVPDAAAGSGPASKSGPGSPHEPAGPARPAATSSINAAAGRGVPEVLLHKPRGAVTPPPAAPPESGPRLTADAGSTEELAAANRARAAACGDLEALREAVAGCTACRLCEQRTQTVFADGTGRSGAMFIGEGPGFHEDRQGVPFVGKAGELLTDIVTKGMKLAREDVYIANVVKCRPPDNRDPSPDEKAICTPWLDRQIELVNPKVLIPLGRHASGHVLSSRASMGAMRDRVHELGGRKVVPTFHPAYLLRSPGQKKACWSDIRRAMAELGLAP